MTSTTYSIWYTDPQGYRIEHVGDIGPFQYVLTTEGLGVFVGRLPHNSPRSYSTRQVDKRFHVYRRPPGGRRKLEIAALTRVFSYSTSASGQAIFEPQGFALEELLARRIVAYYSGTEEAEHSNGADNIMKFIVQENLMEDNHFSGAVTEFPRSLVNYGFARDSGQNQGPSLRMEFAWKNVLRQLHKIKKASYTAGTEVFFGINHEAPGALRFVTRPNLWGQDRTLQTGAKPTVFSLERGNLSSPSLTYDHSEEGNFIYAGGQGTGLGRIIETASDADRIRQSVFGRREKFVTSQGTANETVEAAAQSGLQRHRPLVGFTATLNQTPTCRYGIDWALGDKVTVKYNNSQFEVIIRAVDVRVLENGREDISSRVEL